jgi:hypothetical protein
MDRNLKKMRHQMRGSLGLPDAQLLAKGEQSPREKVAMTMKAFKEGRLRGPGGKDAAGRPLPGPVITNRRQAVAIALAQNGLKKRAPHDRLDAADERVAGMMPHADRLIHHAGKVHSEGATERHVSCMMPHVQRLLGTMPAPRSRVRNNAVVANHRLPLAQIVA